MKILVIDDHPLIREAIRGVLGTLDPNIEMVEAQSAREALALLGAHGMKRGYAQTPVEFARSLGNHPAGESLLSLTRMYNAIRFGAAGAQFNRAEGQALLRALRAALKK